MSLFLNKNNIKKMACNLSKGRTSLPCKDDEGGIKAIYIVPDSSWAPNLFSSYQDSISGNIIYDFTSFTIYKFELKNSGNTFTQDMTSSRDNSTTIFTQTLNVVLPKMAADLEYQLKVLCYANPRVFVELNNGIMFLMGFEYGCEVTAKSEVGGTLDSKTGYTLTIVGTERDSLWYLGSSSDVDYLKSIASTASVAV